jgi:hypothetical protein
MKIYTDSGDYGRFANLLYKERRIADHFYYHLPGTVLAPEWETFEVVKGTDNGKTPSRNPVGNLAELERVGNWTLDARAKEVLESYLAPNGELLPLRYGNEPRWLFNCTNLVRAINLDLSVVDRFSDGKINYLRGPLFFDQKLLENEWIFMPAERPAEIFVTDKFVKVIEDNKLTGFKFKEIWDSEAPVPTQKPVNTQFLHRQDMH